MIDFQCFDCDYHDHGHVYGDSEGWENLKVVRDGQLIINETPFEPEDEELPWEKEKYQSDGNNIQN